MTLKSPCIIPHIWPVKTLLDILTLSGSLNSILRPFTGPFKTEGFVNGLLYRKLDSACTSSISYDYGQEYVMSLFIKLSSAQNATFIIPTSVLWILLIHCIGKNCKLPLIETLLYYLLRFWNITVSLVLQCHNTSPSSSILW